MNHMLAFRSPLMYAGALTFRNNRVGTYEALIDKLANKEAGPVETLPAIFSAWAKRDRERKEPRYLVYEYVQRKLANGETLANALRPFIGDDEFLVLMSGEVRGDLPQALALVIRNLDATSKMRESVAGAMAEPVLGLLSMLLLAVGVGLYMWPDFLRSIPWRFWPGWTHACIVVQMWLGKHWIWLTLLLLLAFWYMWSLRRWTGRWRMLFDRMPPWSIYRGQQASSLLGVLSALIASGRTVRESLVLIQGMSSPYMRWRIRQMISRYDAAGADGMAAVRTGFFSLAIMDRLEDAATNRSFDQTLRHVGDNALRLIVKVVKRQADVANIAFLLFVGALFVYTAAVLVLGVQDATDAMVKSVGG